MQRTFYYDLTKPTKTKMMFTQRVKGGDSTAKLVRDSEIGNIYMTKALWNEMEQPYVLKLVVSTAIPDDPFA